MAQRLRRAVLAGAALFSLPPAFPLAAQDVSLTSREGGYSVFGELHDFDGAFYVIETEHGLLTVNAEAVTCEGSGCPEFPFAVPEISIAGSRLMGEALFPRLLETFAAQNGLVLRNPGVGTAHDTYILEQSGSERAIARLNIDWSGSDQGLLSLMTGTANAALSFNELQDDEVHVLVLAFDAFVPVVAPENPMREISLKQLADVLSGGIGNWSELGGPDLPLELHAWEAGAGYQQALEAALLGPVDLPFSDVAQRHERPEALAEAVARAPDAFGVTLLSQIGDARPLGLAGECPLVSVADTLTVKAGDYLLIAPLFFHVPARRLPPIARELFGFMTAPEAQPVLALAGFITREPALWSAQAQERRLNDAVSAAGEEGPTRAALEAVEEIMAGSSRLKTTFRFEPGEVQPGARSRDALAELVREIEAGRFDGRTLVFVGLTDADGPAQLNLDLSLQRAEAVRATVRAAVPMMDQSLVAMEAYGFGQALPLACDDTDQGRAVNRRVEVWVH